MGSSNELPYPHFSRVERSTQGSTATLAREYSEYSSTDGEDEKAFRETWEGDERIPLATRAFEIVVSIAVLTLTMPVMVVIGWYLRRGTPGPALFQQTRLGINGKPFKFYKFRTLYHDARKRWPELFAYHYTPEELNTLKFKSMDDPRITPQGRWLRKTTLDELPNFWNVLKGEMALVGPRPEIPEMLPYYQGELRKKFSVRPGVTGLAQISGRGNLTFLETAKHDVQYVENRSFWLDVKIILRTLKKIVVGDGAF